MKRGEPFNRTHCQIIFNEGGLGDNIARLVAIEYALKHYKHADLLLCVPDFFIPTINHFFEGRVKVIGFSDLTQKQQREPWFQTMSFMHTPRRAHLVDHAMRYICDSDVPMEEKNYLQWDLSKIPLMMRFEKPYVVLCTGYTAEVRSLPAKTINAVADYVNSRGYDVIWLGKREVNRGSNAFMAKTNSEVISASFGEDVDYSKGIDLIDKTSLLETAKLIAGAKAIVGADNGLLHVAGGTDTWIIAGFTNQEPKFRLPIRKGQLGYKCRVVDAGPGCIRCEANCQFMPDFDSRECVYKDLECREQLTADRFIKELEQIL
jgi:ADP-heptose:LPS heptosyltransferase